MGEGGDGEEGGLWVVWEGEGEEEEGGKRERSLELTAGIRKRRRRKREENKSKQGRKGMCLCAGVCEVWFCGSVQSMNKREFSLSLSLSVKCLVYLQD